MNIIFAVQNNQEWSSKVSSRFGRTEGYILYSEANNSMSYHSNKENIDAGHGAGIQAAQSVADLKAEVVITGGSMGPKAFDLLKSAQIKMFANVGEISVKEAYDKFLAGSLDEIFESDKK